MSANENLVTVKVNVPNPEIQNTEITFANTNEDIESFLAHLAKWKNESMVIRTLTPRNPYGSKGMPVDVKRAKLLAALAELDAAAS